MNKKIFAIIAGCVVILGVVFFFSFQQTTTAQPTVDEQIRLNLALQGEAETAMNYYKGLKNECLDKLTYAQTRAFDTGREKFCREFDELIQHNRAEIARLEYERKQITTREYEVVMGLSN